MIRVLIILSLMAFLAGCATTEEEPPPPEPTPVAQPTPPPPEPEPVMAEPTPPPPPPASLVAEPVLPATAGSLPLVGLSGVGALALAGVVHVVRRRIG